MKKIKLFVLCLALGLFTACGVTKPASLSDLSNATWELDNIKGVEKENLPKPVTLKFEQGKVNGFLGCNNFSGNMDLEKTSAVFSELKGTMKACSSGSVTENHMLKAMSNTTSLNIVKGILQLKKGKEVLAEFKKAANQ